MNIEIQTEGQSRSLVCDSWDTNDLWQAGDSRKLEIALGSNILLEVNGGRQNPNGMDRFIGWEELPEATREKLWEIAERAERELMEVVTSQLAVERI